MNADILRKIVETVPNENGRCFEVVTDKDMDKVRNAIKKYARECKPEEVAAILDVSVFKNGKMSFLLTTDKLYGCIFHLSVPFPETDFIPLTGLRRVGMALDFQDRLSKKMYNKKFLYTLDQNDSVIGYECLGYQDYLAAVLSEIIKASDVSGVPAETDAAGEAAQETNQTESRAQETVAENVPEEIMKAAPETAPEAVPEEFPADRSDEAPEEQPNPEDIPAGQPEETQTDSEQDTDPHKEQEQKEQEQKERLQQAMDLFNTDKKDQALDMMHTLAAEGFEDCYVILAKACHMEKNEDEALHWAEKADELGYVMGAELCGEIYFAKGGPEGYTKAFAYFKRAAGNDSADAEYYLALMYYLGEGTKKDLRKAFNYVESAEEDGCSGRLRTKELQQAIETDLGIELLEHGGSTEREKAVQLLEGSAQQGNLKAQYELALTYKYGRYGVKVNLNQARKYFMETAKKRILSAYGELLCVEETWWEKKEWGDDTNDHADRIPKTVGLNLSLQEAASVIYEVEGSLNLQSAFQSDDETKDNQELGEAQIQYMAMDVTISAAIYRKAWAYANHGRKEEAAEYMKILEEASAFSTMHSEVMKQAAMMFHEGIGVNKDENAAMIFASKVVSNHFAEEEDRDYCEKICSR